MKRRSSEPRTIAMQFHLPPSQYRNLEACLLALQLDEESFITQLSAQSYCFAGRGLDGSTILIVVTSSHTKGALLPIGDRIRRDSGIRQTDSVTGSHYHFPARAYTKNNSERSSVAAQALSGPVAARLRP